MTGPLSGKVVFITGAGRGIGYGAAHVLATDGATVVLSDQDEQPLMDAVARLQANGNDAAGLVCDIAAEPDVTRTVGWVLERYGRIDGLVNNAGVVKVAPFIKHTAEDWEKLTSVNLIGNFLVTRAVVPHLISRGSGSVVSVSSIAALGYTTSHAAYAATKAGLLAMTRELAVELSPHRVRANAVLPGYIRTELSESVAKANESLGPRRPAREPAPDRWGTPRDVGHLVSFLIGDRSSYITGAAITISGGADLAIGTL